MAGEFPVLAAGGLALAGGFAREGKFPSNGGKAIIGTIGLVIVVSALSGTKVAPISNALAWLVLLGAAYGSIPALKKARTDSAKQNK